MLNTRNNSITIGSGLGCNHNRTDIIHMNSSHSLSLSLYIYIEWLVLCNKHTVFFCWGIRFPYTLYLDGNPLCRMTCLLPKWPIRQKRTMLDFELNAVGTFTVVHIRMRITQAIQGNTIYIYIYIYTVYNTFIHIWLNTIYRCIYCIHKYIYIYIYIYMSKLPAPWAPSPPKKWYGPHGRVALQVSKTRKTKENQGKAS